MSRKVTTARTGSLWAVLGAPLVGVPLMVALLALGPGATMDASEPDAGPSLEQVELPDGQEPETRASSLHD